MSLLSSVDCPLCGVKEAMQEDWFYKFDEVFYHCHQCGYGNLFSGVLRRDGKGHVHWNKAYEGDEFGRRFDVKRMHGLLFVGPAFFYPIEAEFAGDYSVYPRSKKGKLVWKLYTPERKLLGEFPSLGKAFEVGDRYADENISKSRVASKELVAKATAMAVEERRQKQVTGRVKAGKEQVVAAGKRGGKYDVYYHPEIGSHRFAGMELLEGGKAGMDILPHLLTLREEQVVHPRGENGRFIKTANAGRSPRRRTRTSRDGGAGKVPALGVRAAAPTRRP